MKMFHRCDFCPGKGNKCFSIFILHRLQYSQQIYEPLAGVPGVARVN